MSGKKVRNLAAALGGREKEIGRSGKEEEGPEDKAW